MPKLCKNCPYFRITLYPQGYEWGTAQCDRYQLGIKFRRMAFINQLTCAKSKEKPNEQ